MNLIIYGNFYTGILSPCGWFFIFGVPTTHGGTDFLCPPFYWLEAPVSAGSSRFALWTRQGKFP